MKALLAALFLSLMSPSLAGATSFVTRPLPETTRQTPTIVRGKIGSKYADWAKNPDGSKRIYTFYELQITEGLKGEAKAGSTIQIRELGGEKDGLGMQIAGTAQFAAGEDVVVMLGEKNQDSSYDVRGLMMGRFGIGRNQSGNEVLVGATGEDAPDAGADAHGPWTMDDFRKLVASQVTGAGNANSASAHKDSPATMPSHSPIASVGVPVRASAAPQLQPDPDQGAAQSSDTGFSWGYAVAAILLMGGLAIGWMTRKKG